MIVLAVNGAFCLPPQGRDTAKAFACAISTLPLLFWTVAQLVRAFHS